MLTAQHSAWGLAFATALVVHGAAGGRERSRFILGLWLSLICAHGAWGLFHLPDAMAEPSRVLQPGAVSVLLVPLGILLVAPWREALAALPLALGVARLGCLPYGCCYEVAWNALPELAGYGMLHLAARRWPHNTTPIVLCGFGAIRLLSLPLRRQPAVEPFVDPAFVAVAWIAAGLLLRHRIGSAEGAREWLTARTEPLLRSLALMLVVWLLFPLGVEVFGESSTALLVGSTLALALLLSLRRPFRPHISPASVAVFAGTLLVGLWVASLADAGLRHLGFAGHPAGTVGAVRAVAVVGIAPVFEELLYRERLLGVLRELWGPGAALVLSSALFAASHMDPAVIPIALAGGLVCGVVMLRTGSLAAVIGLHAGWNLGVGFA